MNNIILGGLAAGALTVLLCTSSVTEFIRNWFKDLGRLHDLVNCCFCASWWISIGMLENFTLVEWAATVSVANLTVLGIHMSMGSVQEDTSEQQVSSSLRREMEKNLKRNGDR